MTASYQIVASGRVTLLDGYANIPLDVSDSNVELTVRLWDVEPPSDVISRIIWDAESRSHYIELTEQKTENDPSVRYRAMRLDGPEGDSEGDA